MMVTSRDRRGPATDGAPVPAARGTRGGRPEPSRGKLLVNRITLFFVIDR